LNFIKAGPENADSEIMDLVLKKGSERPKGQRPLVPSVTESPKRVSVRKVKEERRSHKYDFEDVELQAAPRVIPKCKGGRMLRYPIGMSLSCIEEGWKKRRKRVKAAIRGRSVSPGRERR
jgi:hypothetical protein